MIAAAGYHHLVRGERDGLDLDAVPSTAARAERPVSAATVRTATARTVTATATVTTRT